MLPVFIELTLEDGRIVRTPIRLYPTLAGAAPAVRRRVRLMAHGTGLDWPTLDLSLSVAGVVAGQPERVAPPGFTAWLANRQKALGLPALPRRG